MDVTSGPADNLKDRIFSAARDASPNELTIVTVTGEQFSVYGQLHAGKDYVEFQETSQNGKLVSVPYDKIAYLLF